MHKYMNYIHVRNAQNENREGEEKVNSYGIQIQIPSGRVQEIMDELTAAQETIRRCYDELVMLGVVTIVEKTPICIGDITNREARRDG